jgi:glutamyl-tRNA(Gln) amidotransferase subunit E
MESIRLNLPELPEDMAARFVKEFSMSAEQADMLVRSGYDDEFELLARSLGNPQVVARIYLNTFPELEKMGRDPSKLSVETMRELLTGLNKGSFAKEAIPQLLASVIEHGFTVAQAQEMLGVEMVDLDSVRAVCERVVREREAFIKERGDGALGPLMGIVMKELRGKVDGKVISEILREKIRQLQ